MTPAGQGVGLAVGVERGCNPVQPPRVEGVVGPGEGAGALRLSITLWPPTLLLRLAENGRWQREGPEGRRYWPDTGGDLKRQGRAKLRTNWQSAALAGIKRLGLGRSKVYAKG